MVEQSHHLPRHRKVHTTGSIAFVIIIVVLVIILLGAIGYTFKDTLKPMWQGLTRSKSFTGVTITTPSPTPRPMKTIPGGSQEFLYSHGKDVKGPKIGKATINPLDPKQGDTQTLTVTITHDSPVTMALVTLFTDNAKTPHELKLKNGTTTNGTWEGSWKMTDTYDYTYGFDFTLKSATGEYRGATVIRNDNGTF